jgi:hypothetical protein
MDMASSRAVEIPAKHKADGFQPATITYGDLHPTKIRLRRTDLQNSRLVIDLAENAAVRLGPDIQGRFRVLHTASGNVRLGRRCNRP